MIVFKRQAGYINVEREFTKLDHRLVHIIDVMEAIAWTRWRDHLVVVRVKEHADDGSTRS